MNAPATLCTEPQPLRALVDNSREADMPTAHPHFRDLAAAQLFLRTIYRPELMRFCVPASFNLMRFVQAMASVRTFEFARPWTLTRR